MANIKQIKAKIKSVSNIQQITKALEIVATVKLQKVKQQAENYREFMLEFMKIAQVINNKSDIFNLWDEKKEKKADRELLIVMWTNRGLCWSLNSKLFKSIFTKYEHKKSKMDVFCIGKKSLEFFSRSDFNVVWQVDAKDDLSEDDLQSLFVYIRNAMDQKSYKNIKIYFNYFKNAIQQIPLNFSLYPLDRKSFESFSTELDLNINDLVSKELTYKDMLLEPSGQALLKELREQLLQHMIYWAMLQNKTWEFAARMVAMKNAKDNSTTLIKNLKLSFNKVRQSSITQEISEIMGAKMSMDTKD